MEAYTDALAPEMEHFDVQVGVIEPGNYRSEIGNTGRARAGALDEAKLNSPYVEDCKESIEGSADRSNYKDPDEVAEAALHALFAADPKPHYVVPDRDEAKWTIGTAIQRMVQQNEHQEHAFSREDLIGMLDEALAGDGEWL